MLLSTALFSLAWLQSQQLRCITSVMYPMVHPFPVSPLQGTVQLVPCPRGLTLPLVSHPLESFAASHRMCFLPSVVSVSSSRTQRDFLFKSASLLRVGLYFKIHSFAKVAVTKYHTTTEMYCPTVLEVGPLRARCYQGSFLRELRGNLLHASPLASAGLLTIFGVWDL